MTDPQSKGGMARAQRLSKEERRAIAAAGAQARWARAKPDREKLPRAICGSLERPLLLGEIAIPCYVLEDERRMLTLGGLTDGMGLARGGSMVGGMNRLELFASGKIIKPFIPNDLFERVQSPVVFLTPTGSMAYGYEASILTDLCDAVLNMRAAGVLQSQQKKIAQRCEVLMRALARVGLIALIDEATGFQELRERDALHRILEAYMSKELLPWSRRFPVEFYREMFRLMNWEFDPSSNRKPPFVGKLTNQLVYEKLPPGVLDALRKRNPVIAETKRRRHKHHQFLSDEIGNPHLEKQIVQVVALMRASPDRATFKELFSRAFPPPQGDLFAL